MRTKARASSLVLLLKKPGERSRYSDWLQAGRPRGRSSSPGKVKHFLFSMSSKLILGPTQPPIQWVPVVLSPGVKGSERKIDNSPPSSAKVKKTWMFN
jgi:hypothetical protein